MIRRYGLGEPLLTVPVRDQTAALYLGNADWARPAHLARPVHRGGLPAGDPDWQIHRVVVQRGQQRVSVLWNDDPVPRTVRLPSMLAVSPSIP